MGRPDDDVLQIDRDVLCWLYSVLGLITVAHHLYEDRENYKKTFTPQLEVGCIVHDD